MNDLTFIENEKKPWGLIDHLSEVIDQYIQANPRSRSINALSKKCRMSEATLRRIYRKQVKSSPSVSTVLDILTLIEGENSIAKLAERFPGPIAEFLKESLPDSNFIDISYSTNLEDQFENSTKYIIYKLSSNQSGVTRDKVQQIFGEMGLQFLDDLIEMGFIESRGQVYKATKKNFHSGQRSFLRNFKATSEFIKAYDANSNREFNSVRVNYSESVSEKTYQQILKVQRKALSKIRDLMANEANSGEIPAFVLVGIDTLDTKSFDELKDENSI